MFASTAAVALLSLAAAAQAIINTPTSLRTCEPSLISWDASTAPYYVTVIPGGQPNGATLKNLGTFQEGQTSTTWNVDLAAGTSVTVALKDGTGNILYTSEVSISEGSSSDCVNSNVGASGSAAASAPASAASSVSASVVATAGSASASVGSTVSASASNSITSVSGASASATAKASSVLSSGMSAASKASSPQVSAVSSAAASASAAANNSGALSTFGSYSPVALRVVALVGGALALF